VSRGRSRSRVPFSGGLALGELREQRKAQFFDYYLKGSPPPKWMTEGIPARLKGVDSGLELDTRGAVP
jgi:hypothetical protein